MAVGWQVARAGAAAHLGVLAAAKDPTTAAQDAKSAWDKFFGDWVAPSRDVGVPVLVVLVVLLLLARAAVSLVPAWAGEYGEGTWSRWWQRIVLAAAGFCLLAAAVTLVAGVSAASDGKVHTSTQAMAETNVIATAALIFLVLIGPVRNRLRPQDVKDVRLLAYLVTAGSSATLAYESWSTTWTVGDLIAVSGTCAVAGIVTTASLRGSALGLVISAQDADGGTVSSLAADVRARLVELGGSGPAGLQKVHQADASALSGTVLSLIPDGTLAKAAAALAQLVGPTSPWRVSVEQLAPCRLQVSVTWNGKFIAAETVVPASIGFSGDDPAAVTTAAAAYVLARLSERHVGLRHGLGRCSEPGESEPPVPNWRSLGATAVATDPQAAIDVPKALALLSFAVSRDPKNVAAQTARLNVIYRDSSSIGKSLDYARELEAISRLMPSDGLAETGMEAQQLRILFNLAVAWLNLGHQIRHDPSSAVPGLTEPIAGAKMAAVVDELFEMLALASVRARKQEQLQDFLDDMLPAASVISDAIRLWQANPARVPRYDGAGPDRSGESLTLLARYDTACLELARGQVARALTQLELSLQDAQLRKWARTDTAMRLFDDDVEALSQTSQRAQAISAARCFKALVGDPAPSSIVELAEVAPMAEGLKASGLVNAKAIEEADANRLDTDLKIGLLQARRLRKIAELHEYVEEHQPVAATADPSALTQILLAAGVLTKDMLVTRVASDVHTLRADLLNHAVDIAVVVPPTIDLRRLGS